MTLARSVRHLLALLTFGTVAVLVCATGATAAGSVPYQDPYAHGVVGLCSRSGQPVSAGNIHAKPFAWRAVGSVAAPSGYNGSGRKATLAAFQPRSGADSTEWNGDVLTASSTYTNASHPMAQATAGDEPLADFLRAFPARWDGMVELRLYYSAPNAPLNQQDYAATDIRVSGDTWSVVRGGSPSCTSGSATSAESLVPAAPPKATHNDAAPDDSPVPNPHRSAASAAAASPRPSDAALASTSNSNTNSSGGGGTAVVIALTGAAVLIAAIVMAAVWRRHRNGLDLGRAT